MKKGPLNTAAGYNVGSVTIKKLYVILYSDGTTCLTRFKPADFEVWDDIVAVKEVQIAKGDGMETRYVGAY